MTWIGNDGARGQEDRFTYFQIMLQTMSSIKLIYLCHQAQPKILIWMLMPLGSEKIASKYYDEQAAHVIY